MNKISYYSGSKGDEYPQWFYWKNRKYLVKRILQEERVLDIASGKQIRRFLIETEDGKKFQINKKDEINETNEINEINETNETNEIHMG